MRAATPCSRSALSVCIHRQRLRVELQMQQRRAVRRDSTLEGIREFGRVRNGLAVRSVRARQRCKIRINECGSVLASRISALLVHPYRAVHAVVDDDEDDVETILDGSGELLSVHQEAAVAVPRNDQPLRMHDFGRDGRRHAITHRTHIGRKLGAKLAIAKHAVQPGRIIAGTVRQNSVVGKTCVEPAHDVPQVETAGHRPRRLPRKIICMGVFVVAAATTRRMGQLREKCTRG